MTIMQKYDLPEFIQESLTWFKDEYAEQLEMQEDGTHSDQERVIIKHHHGPRAVSFFAVDKIFCDFCGLPHNKRSREGTLLVHHINHDHDDNRLENFAVLCKSCHSSYHACVRWLVIEAVSPR